MIQSTVAIWRTNRAAVFAATLVLATIAGAIACLQTSTLSSNDDVAVRSPVMELRGTVVDAERLAMLPHPLLRAAVMAIPPTAEEIVALQKIAAEKKCLAEAIYYEARGEGVNGQMAIAEVIFHRLHHRGYPGSICGVVYQGQGSGNCQFSFACDTQTLQNKKSWAAWFHARTLAAKIVEGTTELGNSTGGATAFHAVDVEPDWSNNLEKTVQIGNHVFFRPLARTRAS